MVRVKTKDCKKKPLKTAAFVALANINSSRKRVKYTVGNITEREVKNVSTTGRPLSPITNSPFVIDI